MIFETPGLSANPILPLVFNGGLSVWELKVCGRSRIDGQDWFSKELLSAPAEREALVRFDLVFVEALLRPLTGAPRHVDRKLGNERWSKLDQICFRTHFAQTFSLQKGFKASF